MFSPDSFTYIITSWLDHCITTIFGTAITSSVYCLLCVFIYINVKCQRKIKWHAANEFDKQQYSISTGILAFTVSLPTDKLLCKNPKCTMHHNDIDCFYSDIIYAIKISASHCKQSIHCIDGVTGETAIADLWRNHYQELLNDSTRNDDDVKMDVLESFHNICSHVGMHVTMSEVNEVVKSLPSRKSSGLDGLNDESLKHADPLLCLLLSICYTCIFKHCYMPQSMVNSVIVPLVKNKSGDLTDKNNYRPIALSSIASKVFEHIIILRLEEYLWTNDNQFGFKSGHSTDPLYLCFIRIYRVF